MKRNAILDLIKWKNNPERKPLIIRGARQVGKTWLMKEFGQSCYERYVYFNFDEEDALKSIFEANKNPQRIIELLSLIAGEKILPEETLVIFDEVQECPEIVTAIKFLVEDGQYRYILSGSLLGVELKDIRSMPVGYLSILEMYPLDFREFCRANRVSQTVMDKLKECFEKKQPVDELIHEKMMELFRLYLIVGGMPAVVDAYIHTNNLKEVLRIQQGIVQLYYKDIAKYDKDNKLYLDEIFTLIPSELNNDFKVWNGIQKSYQVGFEVYDGAYDNVHQEAYLTTENTGESTEVRALSYISWDTEYRLKLQAWSLDDSTLVAETVILVPVVDILFANDQHVITVLRPTWTNRYDLHAYGFESGREKGHRAAKLAGYFQGELPLDSNTKFAEIDNMHLPFSQVQFDIGAHEENDYLIMTIYDERYPDHKRNLLLEVEKNPEWWEWKDNK